MYVKQSFVQLALPLKVGMGFLFVCVFVGSLWLSHFSLEQSSLLDQSFPVSAPNSAFSLPLSFVPNMGQTDPAVQFQAHSRSGTLFFTPEAVVVALAEHPDRSAATDQYIALGEAATIMDEHAATMVRLHFVGANPHPEIVGSQQQAGVVNYLFGNDPNAWYTDVSTYAEVIYQDLYPGIDLHYDGTEGLLKGTYVVATGANPDRIGWRYAGAHNTQIDPSTGDLRITLNGAGGGTLIEKAPIAWQEIQGQNIPVTTSYNVAADGTVSLAIGAYDRSYPLIIDPTLEYSTYLGGSGDDFGGILERDAAGNLYIAGRTTSTDFPTTDSPFDDTLTGEEDGFVTKLLADGSGLAFSTYFGGNGDDFLYGFVLDSTGHMYLSGETTSTDLPGSDGETELAGESDGFVARLAPDGNALVFGTYLGGSGTDTASGLAVDSADRVYLVGRTTSTDFPTVNPLQEDNAGEFDFVVARLSTDGTLEYSTYLGGSGNENRRDGGIALNADDEIYILGATTSTDFPTTSGAFQEDNAGGADLFITKLDADGAEILFSTYVGGSANDQTAAFGAHALALDSDGNIYITGLSLSDDFPTTPGVAQPEFGGPNFDGIVAKIAPDGSDLVYSTYLGGSPIGGNGNDFMSGIAVDPVGNVYVTGHVHAVDFPIKNAIQPTKIGSPTSSDANITKLKPDGSLDYSTFFGGSQNEWGHDIEVDDNGTAYVLLYSASDNVQLLTEDAFQPESGGEIDIVIAEVSSVLQVNKVGTPQVAEANSPVTYTLTVENSSPQPVTDVVLTDTVPAGMTLANVTSEASCTEESDEVICDIGDLDVGDLVTTTLVVTTPTTVGPPLVNQAEVTAQHPDPNLGLLTYNVEETTFFDAADMSVAIVAPSLDENSPGDVGAGSPLRYTITVTNTGPDIATGVVLTSTLDEGMQFISADLAAPVCAETEGVTTCDVGTLAADESTTVTIVASAPEERGSFLHTVAVASEVPDQDTTNNTAAASNFVEIYDGEVAVVDTTMAGEPPVFTYTLQLTNTSTWFTTFDVAAAVNAWPTVVTPTEIVALEYREAPDFDPTATITVTVTAPEGTPGDSTDTATITITPRADPDQPITIDLTSRVAAPAPDGRVWLPIIGR